MKIPKLKRNEAIITAWATREDGPGWANSPVWYIVQDGNGKLIRKCLQPEQQTATMYDLFSICVAANTALTNAVRNEVTK